MNAPRHAQGARGSTGPLLDAHKPSNPGVLLGHESRDLTAATGREMGTKSDGDPGATPEDPLAVAAPGARASAASHS